MNRKFSDSLKTLREEHHLSQRQLADALGAAYSTIGMYESGQREPNYEMLEIIADYFNVDMNYLLGKSSVKNSYISELTEIPMDNIVFDDYFPLHYWSGLSAGSFEELIEAEPDSVVYVPITFQNKKKRLHAFKINGTSMNNVIPDGSIVVSEDNYNNAIKYSDGTIVAAFMDGTATVKRLYSGEDSITLSPDSTDKSHMPIIVPKDKELVIIGKVIWHMNPEDVAEKCY
nr:MAG TPA: Repressor protein CI [Caudoviricetes sp.]